MKKSGFPQGKVFLAAGMTVLAGAALALGSFSADQAMEPAAESIGAGSYEQPEQAALEPAPIEIAEPAGDSAAEAQPSLPSPSFARPPAIGSEVLDPWGGGGGGESARRPRTVGRVGALGAPRSPQPTPMPTPTTAAAAPPAGPLPQNAVLASTFVGGRGAAARLEDLLDRGVVVNGENVRLEAFDELGRLPYPVPSSEALGLHAELERTRLDARGERVHMQIAIMARQGEAPPRPRMDVRLVLDRSGSMNGDKWVNAVAAAHQLVDRLQANDTFGLVSYSDDASLDLAPARVGDRRAAHAAINRLEIGGGTNIEAALRMASAHAPRRRAINDVLLVVLVSDGVANVGQTNAQELSGLARTIFDERGVLTTSVGLGTDFDEETMLAIAREGSGSYHFVRRSSDIAEILTDELEDRAQAVAQALRLRIELAEGVTATRVYGSRALDESEATRVRRTEIATDQRLARELGISRDRQNDEERGLRIHIPTFRRGDQHVVLMELTVPAGAQAGSIARVTLDYKDLLSRGNRTTNVGVDAERTRDRDAATASTRRAVKRTVLAFTAGDALRGAAHSLEQGDAAGARTLLHERRELLRAASDLWSDRALARDARILASYERVLTDAWPSWDEGTRRTMVLAMNFYGDRRMQ